MADNKLCSTAVGIVMFSASLHNQPLSLPLWRDLASHSKLSPPDNHTPANSAKPPSASDLNKEITAQKESSLIWQLMSRLLAEKAGEPLQGKTPSESSFTEALVSTQSTYALSIEISMSDAQSAAESSFSFSFSFTETLSEQIRVETETGFVEYTRFSFRAFSMDFQSTQSTAAKQSDPLQIDIDGDGFETGGWRHGVSFDINADNILDE